MADEGWIPTPYDLVAISTDAVKSVARAICNSAGADVFDELDPKSIHYALYMQQALDAIEAMRRASEAIGNRRA